VPEHQPQLYQRICAYQLDDPSHEIGCLAHLMRANGWSRPLYRHPTKGDQEERDRFHELYRATIRNDRQHFGRDLQRRGRIRRAFRPWRG
jgi:hypothetical protein